MAEEDAASEGRAQGALYVQPFPQGPVGEGQVILRDGTTAELRPTTAADRELLLRFLGGLSKEALVQRFHGATSPDAAVAHLMRQGEPRERVTLLVLAGEPDEPRVLATGEYVRLDPGGDAAEVAFLVADDAQGRGLGTLLLERLALLAARHGIRRFTALTQRGNQAMLQVFRTSGFEVRESTRAGEVEVEFSIQPSAESVRRYEMRERVSTVASLYPIFQPRSVAVVGASRKPASIGYRILRYLVENRFEGPVYPVNPHADVVGSIPAYPSVEAIPGPVDLAVVAVPRDAVEGVVEACGEKGVRGLVVITAGFAEMSPEGRALQDRIVRMARGYGMRLIGPNCLGLVNTSPKVRLNASFSPVFPPHGGVAMSSQSGALGLAILDVAASLGLGLSSFVSIGNRGDVSSNDLLQYWEEDADTNLILLYLETFGNPRRFARLARRIGRRKPIVAVKAGRTAAGVRAASSHTAALAASDTAVDALFHQTGVIRVATLEEMFDVAALLEEQPLPRGDRVAVVTNAGGPGILATDALVAEGLEVPTPSEELQARLRPLLPPEASLGNPIDMIASAGVPEFREVVRILLEDDSYDAVLVLYIPVGFADVDAFRDAVEEAMEMAGDAARSKPVLANVLTPDGIVGGSAGEPAHGTRVPTYQFPESAARALAKVRGYARWRDEPPGMVPDHPDLDLERARDACVARAEAGGGWLDADATRVVLEAMGLPLAPGTVAGDVNAAVDAADALGYPVVVKLASTTLVHKSEWSGVALDLPDADAVREACKRIQDRLASAGHEAELDGFLVQPMVKGGTELMVGVTHDPSFGPLVGFGLGGIHVEILRDVVFRITPLTVEDAAEMVRGIKGYPLLEGYRDHAPSDVEAVEDVLLRISRLVEEVPEIQELDLNPVLAFEPGKGCSIVDARIRVRGQAGSDIPGDGDRPGGVIVAQRP